MEIFQKMSSFQAMPYKWKHRQIGYQKTLLKGRISVFDRTTVAGDLQHYLKQTSLILILQLMGDFKQHILIEIVP